MYGIFLQIGDTDIYTVPGFAFNLKLICKRLLHINKSLSTFHDADYFDDGCGDATIFLDFQCENATMYVGL